MHAAAPNVIDPLAADFAPVAELLKRLPRRPSPATVCRWILRGVRGRRLATLKIAGVRYTTEREFCAFFNAIQDAPTERSDAELDALDRQLQAAGYA